MKKKTVALLLVLVLLLGSVISGTVAWLTAKTDPVKNTFTDSNIDITLNETTGSDYKMVPGYKISKDPKVTVEKGSEKCYLFVKLEKSANFDSFLTYTIADGWTLLDGDVYYRVVDTDQMGKAFSVLNYDQVTVKDTVTKAMMDELKADQTKRPTLTVTAYASQFNNSNNTNFTPAEAWEKISK